ncbi:MAG: GIY-YIG nuclease family protein [Flavobacteriales bacterium]|nr:GIY-YIG nuclease family protein [Flavobacteriales bacterium]
MVRGGYVYILTNYNNSVLYTGVTSNIKNRLFEHKNNTHPNSFTSKYNVKKLIFIQSFNTINEAIHFEKYVKRKSRKFKINLIDKNNPNWKGLEELVSDWD